MKHRAQNLKPERLWYYFEEISKIPRASKHEEKIVDYIVSFARDNNLEYQKDNAGNVLIVRASSKGFENKRTIVLQSHMDMVCEKNESSKHDFSKDPIELVIDGEWVKAGETTLGADNGIGMAAMLSILEDKALRTGRIECLFTVEEEIGLNGAFVLDNKMLGGRVLINLDTEEVGSVYIGCAGGRDSHITLPLSQKKPEKEMKGICLEVRGLKGGHSGAEIHKGRANAIRLMARILKHLRKSVIYFISSLKGGDKLNAIPREAFSLIVVNRDSVQDAKRIFNEYCLFIKDEFEVVDPDIIFEILDSELPESMFNAPSTEKIVNLLMALPHGVISNSAVMDGLVETSTNLASVRTETASCHVKLSHRSSRDSALSWVSDIHTSLSDMCGSRIEQDGVYPGWNPDPDSELLKHAKRASFKILGKEADVKAIHAGLECGVIKQKYEGMDVISIGPTIEGAHSPEERVNIKSVETFWKILLETLKEIYKS